MHYLYTLPLLHLWYPILNDFMKSVINWICSIDTEASTENVTTSAYFSKKSGSKELYTPMHYTAICMAVKNDNFQMKTWNMFHIFAEIIDCAYS